MGGGVPPQEAGGLAIISGERPRDKDRVRGSGDGNYHLSIDSPALTVAFPQTCCVSYHTNRTLSCLSWPSRCWAWLCGLGRAIGLH